MYYCCCSSYVICCCWCDCRIDVIWIYFCCCNFDASSIWSCWTSWILCSLVCICCPIFMAINAYSWELTSYTTNFIGSRICSDTYVLPPTSFLGLSFPPLRSPSSSSIVLVLDGLTPNNKHSLLVILKFISTSRLQMCEDSRF